MILQGESLVRSSKSWFFPRRYGEIICCSQSCLFFLLKAKITTDGLAFDNLYYWPYITGHCGSWSIPFVMCKTIEEINQQWPKTCHYHQSKKLWISNTTFYAHFLTVIKNSNGLYVQKKWNVMPCNGGEGVASSLQYKMRGER